MSTHPTKVLADDMCAGNLPFELTDLAGFRTPGITETSGIAELSEKGAGSRGGDYCLDYFSPCRWVCEPAFVDSQPRDLRFESLVWNSQLCGRPGRA